MPLALLIGLVSAAAGSAAPSPGRYEAVFCVTTSATAPPSCGAADFDLQPSRHAQVRIADIVYHLHLRPEQVDISTMQGKMQIDEFSAFYEWSGNVLRFRDPDKTVLYEVKVGARRR